MKKETWEININAGEKRRLIKYATERRIIWENFVNEGRGKLDKCKGWKMGRTIKNGKGAGNGEPMQVRFRKGNHE